MQPFPYMPGVGAEGFAAMNPYLAAYGAPFAAAAALPYAAAYGGRTASQPQAASEDEQRTVYLTGFPEDTKERELNNLLRFLPGYEASQMHWKNGQAQGFALFSSNSAAVGACEAIAGLCFDDNVYLRAEMARKNMYIGSTGAAAASQAPEPKRQRAVGAYGGAGAGAAAAGTGSYAARPGGAAGARSDVTKDNPPCNTLFVGNLGDTADESELRQLFGQQQGFVQLKLITGRAVSCFVEFDSVANATAAHQALQGTTLSTSTRGGIRIQFSKNSFGSRKRDAEGNIIGSGAFDGSAGSAGAGAGAAAGGYKPNMGGMYDPAAAAAAAIAAATGIPQQ